MCTTSISIAHRFQVNSKQLVVSGCSRSPGLRAVSSVLSHWRVHVLVTQTPLTNQSVSQSASQPASQLVCVSNVLLYLCQSSPVCYYSTTRTTVAKLVLLINNHCLLAVHTLTYVHVYVDVYNCPRAVCLLWLADAAVTVPRASDVLFRTYVVFVQMFWLRAALPHSLIHSLIGTYRAMASVCMWLCILYSSTLTLRSPHPTAPPRHMWTFLDISTTPCIFIIVTTNRFIFPHFKGRRSEYVKCQSVYIIK